MLELLKTHFGYDAFLPMQKEVIGSVMAGQDCFVLMPTGGGKSLCYQLPAMALPGLTLVVSPLIALMKDQVDALEANGLPAAFINSTQTPDELRRVVRRIRSGEIKLLYVAPERVIEPRFADFLQTLDVSLVAIDEAHCVSEWGHEFRPAYRELANLRRVCPGVPGHCPDGHRHRASASGYSLAVGIAPAGYVHIQLQPPQPHILGDSQGE